MNLRAKQFIQKKIALRQLGFFAIQYQLTLQSVTSRRCRGLPAMIRLRGAKSYQRIGVLGDGIGHQEL